MLTAIANVDEAFKQKCYESGCNGLITKPFYENEIYSALVQHLPIEATYETDLKIQKVDEILITLPDKAVLKQILKLSQEGDITVLNRQIQVLSTKENGKFAVFANKIRLMAKDFRFEDIEKYIEKEK